MPTTRRHILTALLASALAPKLSWADAGAPAFLSAAARPDGRYVLCGIDSDLNVTFQRPLPARGHAAAAHPTQPLAVAFARRPGTFAIVMDCATGTQTAQLTAPQGRHFYGHGAFSSDGALLFTTENDYDAGQGCIGVWDTQNGFKRVDEWHSGGVGPHDIHRLPGSETLVVANGGIETHPDSGRTKLNIATMRPNLTYLEGGQIVEQAELAPDLHKNSIRHMALSPSGQVAFGMQWQGQGTPPALVATHQRGAPITLMQADPDQLRRMDGYVGSVAFSGDGNTIAVTSPRGGLVQYYDAQTQRLTGATPMVDVCGIGTLDAGFVLTSGSGDMQRLHARDTVAQRHDALHWDNHLIAI